MPHESNTTKEKNSSIYKYSGNNTNDNKYMKLTVNNDSGGIFIEDHKSKGCSITVIT